MDERNFDPRPEEEAGQEQERKPAFLTQPVPVDHRSNQDTQDLFEREDQESPKSEKTVEINPVQKPKGEKKDKKIKQKPSGVWASILGGIVGSLVTILIFLGLFHFTDIFSKGSVYQGEGSTITINPSDLNSEVEAIAEIVPKSVVGIYTEGQSVSTDIFGFGFPQDVAASGSGFIVTSDGYIVTNNHVIMENSSKILVYLSDDSEHEAKVIWSDSTLDMAVIKIEAENLPAVTLGDSNTVKIGEQVVAIGNPLGLNFSRTVTAGIVSAVNRSLVVDQNLIAEDLIQTDAAINSGNSGGPLVNTEGRVIGINTYKASTGEGIGFAIPINILKPILNDIVKTGSFSPASIGITAYDQQTASYIVPDLDISRGIYVEDVSQNTPAQRAGLRKGDIILKADGKDVNTMLSLKEVIYTKHSGDTLTLTIERGGSEQTVDVKI